MGELYRTVAESFKHEKHRLSIEESLDNLEKELNEMIRAAMGEEPHMILRAQQLRREMGSLEQKIKECDFNLQSLLRKEVSLEN